MEGGRRRGVAVRNSGFGFLAVMESDGCNGESQNGRRSFQIGTAALKP